MFNKAKRIISLLLALIMVFTFSACSKKENTSDEVEFVYAYEYEYEEVEGEDTGDSGEEGDGKTNNSSKNNNSNKNNKDNNVSNINDRIEETEEKDYSHLKGTKVRYATWKDPDFNEDGPVIDKFEDKYGIDVIIDMIDQETYVNQISGLIAADNSPDVYFSTYDFPSCMSCLQSLDATKIDYDDPIWNQGTFKKTTYGGSPYLCDTVGNVWAETDMIYYNKSLLKQANCWTPEEYDRMPEGWTWDSLEAIMTACSKLPGVTGGAFINTDTLFASLGCGTFYNKDGVFYNGANNSESEEYYRRVAKWVQDGIIANDTGTWLTGFIEGKVAIVASQSFGLKKTGWFADMNFNNIGFYYLPDYSKTKAAVPTGIFRGWGLIRGAKNPEGAGAFLYYYLNVNNYDVEDAFISPEAANFFAQLNGTTEETNHHYTNGSPLTLHVTNMSNNAATRIAFEKTPSQVKTELAAVKPSIDLAVKKLNEYTKANTGYK